MLEYVLPFILNFLLKKSYSQDIFFFFNQAQYMYIILQHIYISDFIVIALKTTGVDGFRFFRRQKRIFLFIYFWLCKEPGENSI